MFAAPPAVLLMLPAMPVTAPTGQAPGPRPVRDPDGLPDGKTATGRLDLSFNLSAVSDYRFRGISQTSGHPAVQMAAEITGPKGIYVGAWVSTIASYEGAHIETDVYAGYRTRLGGADLDVGVISYLYPGSNNTSSAELYVTGAHEVGDATFKVGGSYTPQQSNLGSGDGSYLFAELEKPVSKLPATFRGHVGRESGVSTPTGSPKTDWLVGLDVRPGPFTLSVAWVDARYQGRTGEADHRSRAVLAIAFDF